MPAIPTPNLLQSSGEHQAPASSPGRFQPNCKSLPGRRTLNRSGQGSPSPCATGSPGLLSSPRTGGSCITWCQGAPQPVLPPHSPAAGSPRQDVGLRASQGKGRAAPRHLARAGSSSPGSLQAKRLHGSYTSAWGSTRLCHSPSASCRASLLPPHPFGSLTT